MALRLTRSNFAGPLPRLPHPHRLLGTSRLQMGHSDRRRFVQLGKHADSHSPVCFDQGALRRDDGHGTRSRLRFDFYHGLQFDLLLGPLQGLCLGFH